MINEGKIPASSILVVTFSRAAATEMKERFLKFVGQNRSEVTFGTFHGIFYGILKAAYHLSAANILSEEEKFSILREMTEKYGQEMAQEGDFIEEVAREISVVRGTVFLRSIIMHPVARMRYSGTFFMAISRL